MNPKVAIESIIKKAHEITYFEETTIENKTPLSKNINVEKKNSYLNKVNIKLILETADFSTHFAFRELRAKMAMCRNSDHFIDILKCDLTSNGVSTYRRLLYHKNMFIRGNTFKNKTCIQQDNFKNMSKCLT